MPVSSRVRTGGSQPSNRGSNPHAVPLNPPHARNSDPEVRPAEICARRKVTAEEPAIAREQTAATHVRMRANQEVADHACGCRRCCASRHIAPAVGAVAIERIECQAGLGEGTAHDIGSAKNAEPPTRQRDRSAASRLARLAQRSQRTRAPVGIVRENVEQNRAIDGGDHARPRRVRRSTPDRAGRSTPCRRPFAAAVRQDDSRDRDRSRAGRPATPRAPRTPARCPASMPGSPATASIVTCPFADDGLHTSIVRIPTNSVKPRGRLGWRAQPPPAPVPCVCPGFAPLTARAACR